MTYNVFSGMLNLTQSIMCCIPSDKINLYQVTFAFEFDEFWKLKFAFDECEF